MESNQECLPRGDGFTVRRCTRHSINCSIFGGPAGDRTPTKGLQSPCAPIITTSPNFGIPGGTRTPTNGFGDRHAAITPPRHNSNTLLRMCVLKHTVITTILLRLTADVSVQYALIRSDFFMYKNISHPRGRPFVV